MFFLEGSVNKFIAGMVYPILKGNFAKIFKNFD